MKIPDFELHSVKSLSEACKLLAKYGPRAKAIAGGTDLLVDLKEHLVAVEHLVSLSEIPEADAITFAKGKLSIGALATLSSVASNPFIQKHFPALSDTALSMATPQIRNTGTIGGNIASAVPSADIPPALMCADAHIITISTKGKKNIPIRNFFAGVRKTVLEKDGLIKTIEIDIPKSNMGVSYQKFALREAAALAVVGVAAMIETERNIIKDVCIVLGAVAPTPVIAHQACKFLNGKEPTTANFNQAGVIACDEGKPISDIRASKEYRCHLIGVLTRRALTEAYKKASKNGGNK